MEIFELGFLRVFIICFIINSSAALIGVIVVGFKLGILHEVGVKHVWYLLLEGRKLEVLGIDLLSEKGFFLLDLSGTFLYCFNEFINSDW